MATENIDGDENILIKNIYKDNLPIEIYEKNRSEDEIHIFYHYKENQLIEEEKYTRFFNGHYYSTTKEKIQYDEKCRIKKFYDYEEEKIVRTYTHYYDDKDRIIKTELLYSNNSNNKKNIGQIVMIWLIILQKLFIKIIKKPIKIFIDMTKTITYSLK